MQFKVLLLAAAQVLLLQVTQIEGKYTSCKAHSNIVSKLIDLSDSDVLNCPTAIIGKAADFNCCFDRWGQKDGTFFCCNNMQYFFFEIFIVFILPILLLLSVALCICRCFRCLCCS